MNLLENIDECQWFHHNRGFWKLKEEFHFQQQTVWRSLWKTIQNGKRVQNCMTLNMKCDDQRLHNHSIEELKSWHFDQHIEAVHDTSTQEKVSLKEEYSKMF